MNSKYYLTPKILPFLRTHGNVAFAADDLLFDWTPFEIPKGTASLKNFLITMPGTDSVAANGDLDFEMLFAKAVDGVIPPSLGTVNSAMTVIAATAARPWIIGKMLVDGGVTEDSGDGLVGYNILAPRAKEFAPVLVLEGDPAFAGSSSYDGNTEQTTGYQTIWVAGIAQGAYDFGTACLVAGTHSADDLTIVVDGTDCDDLFAVGETVVAYADAGTGIKTIGKVTAVAADLLTVDAAPQELPDDHEICLKSPITIRLGFEY